MWLTLHPFANYQLTPNIMEKTIERLKRAIKARRFSFAYGEREWYGIRLIVEPLFCSYGQMGYAIYVYDYGTILYDYELDEITEDIN